MNQVSCNYNSHVQLYCVHFLYTVPSDPVQNVMVSNVSADLSDNIAVIVTWDPPSDPNGFIRYYRLEYQQSSDPLSDDRTKRNIDLDDIVTTVFVNFTGVTEAPTDITLRGLS